MGCRIMSKRHLVQDVDKARKRAYSDVENSGESLQALWELVAVLKEQGIEIGPRSEAILAKRAEIKRRAPR